MHTIKYRGHYIHCYTNKPECSVLIDLPDGGVKPLGHFKSLHAAKIAITKSLTKEVAA